MLLGLQMAFEDIDWNIEVSTTKELIGLQVGAILTGAVDSRTFDARIEKLVRSANEVCLGDSRR